MLHSMLVASLEWTGYLALSSVATSVPMGLLAAKFYKRTRRKVGRYTQVSSFLASARALSAFL